MAVPFCSSKEVIAQTNEGSSRNLVNKPCTARTSKFLTFLNRLCGCQVPGSRHRQIPGPTSIVSSSIGSHFFTINNVINNFGTASFEFVTFTAHGLDQDGKMELATARNFITKTIWDNLKSDVSFKLAFETLSDLARSSKLTFLTL